MTFVVHAQYDPNIIIITNLGLDDQTVAALTPTSKGREKKRNGGIAEWRNSGMAEWTLY